MADYSNNEQCRETIQRINRIQGQLNSLKKAIEDDKDCELLVIQAHTIERAVSSLMLHIVNKYFEHTAIYLLKDNPEEALENIERLFELSHR